MTTPTGSEISQAVGYSSYNANEYTTYFVIFFPARIDVFLNCIGKLSNGSAIVTGENLDFPEFASWFL